MPDLETSEDYVGMIQYQLMGLIFTSAKGAVYVTVGRTFWQNKPKR